MTTTTINTYRVRVVETLSREYRVTTSGGESRAVELAETGDYGLTGPERVELLDDYDNVVNVRIVGVDLDSAEGGAR